MDGAWDRERTKIGSRNDQEPNMDGAWEDQETRKLKENLSWADHGKTRD